MARERRSSGPNFRGKIGKNAQRQKREGKSYGYLMLPKDVSMFKEEVTTGRDRIELDILPYLVTLPNHPDKEEGAVKGEYWYRRPYWVHHNVGVENKAMVCPKTIGKPCPICEYRQNQFKNPDIKKDEIIGKPQLKNIYAVIVLNQKDYEKDKIYLWDIAQGNFQAELIDDLAERPELEVFPSLEDGLTLSIRFNEEVFNRNKFAQAGRIDYLERDYNYPESILDDVPALDEVLKILSYEELEKVFLELDDDDVESEEKDRKKSVDKEDEQESSSRRRKTVSRVAKEDDEESEEEKAPRSSRKKKEEPEEEQEEEKAPPLSRSKSSQPTQRRRRREEPEPESSQEECPNGHEFGKDWDDYEDCEGCELFETCGEKYEQLNS
jgi:hypothetical protein